MTELCEYPVRDKVPGSIYAGPLRDCGKPATHRGVQPPKKFYCADHNAMVSRRGGLQTKPINGTKGQPT